MSDDDKVVLELTRHWVSTQTDPALMHPNNIKHLLGMHDAQAATIEALADALIDNIPPERVPGCWCPPSRNVERAGHQPPCARARAALRLAGRLE